MIDRRDLESKLGDAFSEIEQLFQAEETDENAGNGDDFDVQMPDAKLDATRFSDGNPFEARNSKSKNLIVNWRKVLTAIPRLVHGALMGAHGPDVLSVLAALLVFQELRGISKINLQAGQAATLWTLHTLGNKANAEQILRKLKLLDNNPLPNLTDAQVEKWLDDLSALGCIEIVDGSAIVTEKIIVKKPGRWA